MRHHTEDETDDAPKTVHVPLFQMDSRRFDDVQRSVAATFGDIEKLRRLRDEAYQRREQQDQAAWKGDNGDDDDTETCESCGAERAVGEACEVCGTRASLTRAGDGRRHADASNPRSPHFNIDAARQRRVQAYAHREVEDREAWRKGKF